MSSIKIIVMGVGGVGKSAITNRFVMGRWVEKVQRKICSWACFCL
jgi:GTPase SAR1 family protein